jgi:hypothetical protein
MKTQQLEIFALVFDSFYENYQKNVPITPQLLEIRGYVFADLTGAINNILQNKPHTTCFDEKIFWFFVWLFNEMFSGIPNKYLNKDKDRLEIKLRNESKGLLARLPINESFKKKYVY